MNDSTPNSVPQSLWRTGRTQENTQKTTERRSQSYKDPTASAAIANIMREERRKEKEKHRQQKAKHPRHK